MDSALINEPALMHPFERAGLGKAPFRFVGTYEAKFQAIPGDPSCPIQPGASCDYCAQGIMQVCCIRSADGREFKVGCDCVRKTGDKKLSKAADEAQLKRARAKRAAVAAQSKDELTELLASDEMRAKLASHPHPQQWAAEHGKKLLDWADWMAERAGAAGRKRVLTTIRQAVAHG